MDFQTMGRKVKQKQYKSKKEFKDDLDLIWSNCFLYNATEVRHLVRLASSTPTSVQNHPLRLCATRLKSKAEHLLKYITDRKERADPPVPIDLSGRRTSSYPPTRVNGINGHAHTLSFLNSRPPSSDDTRSGRRLTPAPTPPRRIPGQSFPESPAIVRTASGMAAILELERSLDAVLSEPGPSSNADALDALLSTYIGESESDADGEGDSDSEGVAIDYATGDKRKLFVTFQFYLFNANHFLTATVLPTLVSISAPVSQRLVPPTPLSSGGRHNRLTPSSRTPSRLSLPSPLPARSFHPPHPDRKNSLAALQH